MAMKHWMAGIVAVVCLSAAPLWAGITYEMVTVGDPGNPRDAGNSFAPNVFGRVDYIYGIGKYDVTIGQYTAFLNAVAQTDTYALYNTNMGTDLNIAGISRSGSSGSYFYSVMDNGGSSANRPITYVSWFDAARFANWMANGQPIGAQSATTTENGAYDLITAATGTAPAKNGTNPNTGAAPTFSIPTENEWYKAAYYSPNLGGPGVGGYYAYATQDDTEPGNVVEGTANQANYRNLVYSVTQSSVYESSQNYLTDVGAFTGSVSFYGTFDQSGNVSQWNDLDGTAGSTRGSRGGYWDDRLAILLTSASRGTSAPSFESSLIGFRLASPVSSAPVPEIDPAGMGSVLALVTGALGLLERRQLKAI